ncbi:protein FAM184B isoform X3 [Dromaius novaehollandiae]|uniref:protein FAM184B isoform X3 n=1 Tax=Dromaius novaehollandiae TaxID=8790 RepID=UPI0031201303
MASGAGKARQPGARSGAGGGSPAAGCSQEVHVKMCKKIAQLTKVIYALNTKNDEHEASIQALKDAHEEEIQHILAETRKTILQYKSKVEEEQLLRKRIQVLEDAVEQHKRLKEEALAELTLFKKQVEGRELRMEVKQAQMILSTDTVDTNADFENKLLHLNREHEGLLDECKTSSRENLDRKEILDEKYSVEGQALINEMENLKSENQRVIEECTQKTSQLQASYQREKETLKKAMRQSMAERQKNCQQRELEQRKTLEAHEGFLLQQVKKLETDLEEKTWKVNEKKKHSQKLKEKIQDSFLGHTDLYKLQREGSRCQEMVKAQSKTRSEDKSRLESTSVSKMEDIPSSLTCSQKEKARDIKTLQEEWHSQKADLEAQVAQLKQILNQQASNFKEALKKHDLQSNKEKEKLLQDLQNTIKENQNVKLQLESSHQKILKMLEKSKNQELKVCLQEAEERLKKEFNETFKIQRQSHKLEIQTLEEKAKKELHDELEQIQKQQTLLLGSLRMELSEQQTLCTRLKKQIEELQMELRSVRTLKKQQARSSQSQIRSLHDELEKSQHEVSGLKKENLLLKDAMELLSAELGSQRQEAAQLQDREKQHRSSTQAHLQAKIFSLETELKGLEAKPRKQESRPEDIHLISCLQDKISEREETIKQLVEGRQFQHSLLANTESYRNRSFSFNPNLGCLTPSMKQKKMDEVPSRVVSVPNLASYARSFLSCDLRSKRSAPQIPKSASLDQSPGCLRMGYLSTRSSDSSAATRTHNNEALQTKDDRKRTPQHQEWFTKYFSF